MSAKKANLIRRLFVPSLLLFAVLPLYLLSQNIFRQQPEIKEIEGLKGVKEATDNLSKVRETLPVQVEKRSSLATERLKMRRPLVPQRVLLSSFPERLVQWSPPPPDLRLESRDADTKEVKALSLPTAIKDNWQVVNDQAKVAEILIVVDRQMLYAFDELGNLAFLERVSTASTGINLTPGEADPDLPHNHLGAFFIQTKKVDAYSQLYDCPMHYAMFYHKGHAIHQTEKKYERLLGSPASHGCVREAPDAAAWLYDHTPLHTPLVIQTLGS